MKFVLTPFLYLLVLSLVGCQTSSKWNEDSIAAQTPEVALSAESVGESSPRSATPDSKVDRDLRPSFERDPQAAEVYIAERLTPPGLFTKGIEGPASSLNQQVFAVNFKSSGKIGVVFKSAGVNEVQEFLQIPEGGVANSIRIAPDGSMFFADYKGHRVLRLKKRDIPSSIDQLPVDDKKLEVFFKAAPGSMHQPNDMSLSADGSIYLSDPTWKKDQWGRIFRIRTKNSPSGEWQFQSVQQELLDFTVPKSELPRVPKSLLDQYPEAVPLKAPNGIEVSPDGKRLYFGDSQHGNVYVADITGQGLKNPRVFLRLKRETLDGIRTDSEGNVYVARTSLGQVHRFPADYLPSPNPAVLSEPMTENVFKLQGKNPSNLAFGGPDGRTVFVTLVDCGCIEWFRVRSPGREWKMLKDAAVKK